MSDTLTAITSVTAIETTITIDLGDFREEYRGAVFDVWVQPSRRHWNAWNEYVDWITAETDRLNAEKASIEDEDEAEEFDRVQSERLEQERVRRLDKWLAETWRNISRDETTAIREHLQSTYMEAWNWLFNTTISTMIEYHEDATKN